MHLVIRIGSAIALVVVLCSFFVSFGLIAAQDSVTRAFKSGVARVRSFVRRQL